MLHNRTNDCHTRLVAKACILTWERSLSIGHGARRKYIASCAAPTSEHYRYRVCYKPERADRLGGYLFLPLNSSKMLSIDRSSGREEGHIYN